MSSPTKAVPRDKTPALASGYHLVTGSVHFINGSLVQPGAVVRLPEGVTAGEKLVPCDADGTPSKPAKGDKAE